VPTFNFQVAESSVSESVGNLLIKVIRTENLSQAASVSYQTSAGTASVDTDFIPASGTLNFPVSSSEQTIVVPIVNDELIEALETFTVSLSNPINGVLGPRSAHSVTIVNDDGPATIEFAGTSSSVAEASGQAVVTLVRSGNTTTSATVEVAASAGSATNGSDYSFQTTTITFAPGVTQQTVTVSLVDDSVEEGDEDLSLVLSNPGSGVTLGSQTSHTVTILANDPTAVISFAAASSSVAEASGQAVVTLVRSGNTTASASVQISGSAPDGSDYVLQDSSVYFPGGVTERTVTIFLVDDGVDEGDEQFELMLSNPGSGATLGSQTTHTITILDDAEDLPKIAKASYRGLAASTDGAIPEYAGITVKTTDSGQLTGTLQIRGKTLRLRGRFSDAGTFSRGFAWQTQSGPTGVVLELQPDSGGSVLRGSILGSDGTTFQVEAKRETIGTRSNPVSEANDYTALLGTQLEGNPAGFLRTEVKPSGRITLSAMLPDGTRLSASSHLTEDRSFPIFIPAYARKLGHLAGPAQFEASTSLPLTGELHWKKPANSRPPYAGGFDDELIELSGAVYTPLKRQRILDDYDSTQGRAVLQLSGVESSDVGLSWTERNVVNPVSQNPAPTRVTLQPETGLWTGSFRDSSGQRHKFYGICLQQPDAGEDLAAGFYLGESTAGRVELRPQD
jgi:hypothetical protein